MLDVAGWARPWNTDEVHELDEVMALVGDSSDDSDEAPVADDSEERL